MNLGPVVKIKSNSKKAKKGLPKRTGKNRDRAKANHAAYLSRLLAKRQARAEAQAAAHARNVARGYSEWDLAKAKRLARRHA